MEIDNGVRVNNPGSSPPRPKRKIGFLWLGTGVTVAAIVALVTYAVAFAGPAIDKPTPAKTDLFLSFADLGYAGADGIRIAVTGIYLIGDTYKSVQEDCGQSFLIARNGDVITQRALQVQITYRGVERICLAEPTTAEGTTAEGSASAKVVRQGIAVELLRVAESSAVHTFCDLNNGKVCADARVPVNHLTIARADLTPEQTSQFAEERRKENLRNVLYAAVGALFGVLLTLGGSLITTLRQPAPSSDNPAVIVPFQHDTNTERHRPVTTEAMPVDDEDDRPRESA